MTMRTQSAVETYSFEFLLMFVRSDSKEFEKRLEVVQLIHHGCSGQTPTKGRIKCATCFVTLCQWVFDVLCLIHNDPVEFAVLREEDRLATVQLGDLRTSARFFHFVGLAQKAVVGP